MATKIFPSVNDVNGGVAGQGKTLTEANLKTFQALPYFDKPYVKSGAVCSNGGGLNLNVATGHYCIDGRWVYKDATEVVALTASATNRVWLQLTKDGSGNVTGTTWNVQTGTTVPADAVLVAVVVTGAATITTITNSFRGVISPGKMVGQAISTVQLAAGDADKLSLAGIVGDGATEMRFKMEGQAMATATDSWDVTGSLRDGASGTGTEYGAIYSHEPDPNFGMRAGFEAWVPAYTDAKTFYWRVAGSAPTLAASATRPKRIRAYWDF